MERLVLGYHYRRKRVQERYDRPGADSRIKGKVLKKLGERKRKSDIRWKIANIVVRTASKNQYAIVLEKLGKKPANNMITKIRDRQLRHRIYQASFRGIQKAIEEKAREYGAPIVYVNPKDTSKLCPVHKAVIVYDNDTRIGKCTKGGEQWHRDVAACWNLLLKACLGNGSIAPSPGRSPLDGSPVPLGSTATHEPTEIPRSLWARWKSLEAIPTTTKHPLGTNGSMSCS